MTVRFSVAIGGELLRKFDRYRTTHRYANRSEAVRGLMRAALIEEAVARDDSLAVGVVTLIYDHHAGRLAERLTELQHAHLDHIVTTTHVHLDATRCLEVVLLRGRARIVREIADGLIGVRGVESGRCALAAAEAIAPHDHLHDLAGEHAHPHPHEASHDHESPAREPKPRKRSARVVQPKAKAPVSGRKRRG